jgi:hypothetical protein
MAGFFTRPNLSDIQFRQLTGDTLNLSGTTNFSGILKSKGVEIDATFSGITGSVLTYIDGKIRLAPQNGLNGDINFDSNRITTRQGIPSVNVGGTTVKDFLEGYFFPSIPPIALISGGGTRLFGNNSNLTLNWSVTRKTLPITSITVNGILVPSGFFSALPIDGFLVSATTATINTPNVNQSYTINVNTSEENINSSTSINFSHKRYYFQNNQDLISFSDINTSNVINTYSTLSNSEFSNSISKSTFSLNFVNQFFYYVHRASLGNATFTINGLANNDFSTKDFSFTNEFGFIETFRIYKSNNPYNGTINIAIS